MSKITSCSKKSLLSFLHNSAMSSKTPPEEKNFPFSCVTNPLLTFADLSLLIKVGMSRFVVYF